MDEFKEKEQRGASRWHIERSAQLKLEGAVAPADCQVKDISFKGLRMVFRQKLATDTFVKLSICLDQECILNIEVWVVWHKIVMDTNVYGLYFTKIQDSDKNKLYRFIQANFPQLLRQQWWKGLEKPEGGASMQDKRIFSRLPVKFPVRFLDPNQNKEGQAQTQDISAKGLGVISDAELTPSTSLELWLQIPDNGEPLYTRGNVVWSKKIEENQYRTGISLEKADLMGLSRVLRIS